MGKNSLSLPGWWGYSPPPGEQPEHDTENQKTHNRKHASPDPPCSGKFFQREVLLARLLIVCAASGAGLDMALLRACHLQRRICKAADGDNMLL
jgi:hypothetical protein